MEIVFAATAKQNGVTEELNIIFDLLYFSLYYKSKNSRFDNSICFHKKGGAYEKNESFFVHSCALFLPADMCRDTLMNTFPLPRHTLMNTFLCS